MADDALSIYDEIEIEDMTFDPALQIYHFPCPCGDRFEIAIDDLRDGEDIGVCPSCSLMIRVIYDLVRIRAATISESICIRDNIGTRVLYNSLGFVLGYIKQEVMLTLDLYRLIFRNRIVRRLVLLLCRPEDEIVCSEVMRHFYSSETFHITWSDLHED